MTTRTDAGVPASEDDALGLVEAGEAVGIPTATILLKSVAATIGQPRSLLREVRRFGRESVQIVAGKSKRAPAKGDKRFTDPAWSANPAFRRLCAGVPEPLRVDRPPGRRSRRRHARLAGGRARPVRHEHLHRARSRRPTSCRPTRPRSSALFDTGGMSVVRGAGNFLGDLENNGGMP